MEIVILTRGGGSAGQLNLARPLVFVSSLLILISCLGLFTFFGYSYGLRQAAPNSDSIMAGVDRELADQHRAVEDAKREAREHMDALALRLGELQAQLMRIDALGERLTELADLEKGEFDFAKAPGVGGPQLQEERSQVAVVDFIQALDQLSEQLSDRREQLGVLETLLMNRNLQHEVFPAGRPAAKGWVSSRYGKRADPFTGRLAHHAGIDMAGKLGSDVIATAAGVVTWSGPRYGYGNMVELNHGNGYVTRYAHNLENVVAVGDKVEQGSVVAKMGTSGRSTGPHVHFEVIVNGRNVDPMRYLRASR